MQGHTPLILLVGMHRSGTSLLGSLLPHLGVAMPGDLIAGDVHNPEGYFERRDVVDLQEQLLIDFDRFWAGSRGPEPLPRGWLRHPSTQRCARALTEILMRERARQRGPWAIKDPRSSVLLPLWRELCAQLEIPLQVVLAVRSPEAVVASVMARDERLAGMTWWRAQQLWWRFNAAVVAAERPPGESAPILVHYEAWFADPEAQALALAAALGLPRPSTAQLSAALQSIRPEHRHQQPLPATAPPLDPRLWRLHSWLLGQRRLLRPRRLTPGPLHPRRSWRQEMAHRCDWIWLIGTPLLPPGGLFSYRRRFLQGEGAGPLVSLRWLARQRPGLTRRHRDPLAWYRRCGWRSGVSPHPLIEPARLWERLGCRREVVGLYRRHANRADLTTHACFDPVHYGQQCRQANRLAQPTPLEHYLQEGWLAGLSPHPAVDPGWMRQQHGLPGEPLTALLLNGADVTDPGLTHPRGHLYGAALAHPQCTSRLPRGLVDLLQLWHARRLWPAERWLDAQALQDPLPSFDLFGREPSALFAAGLGDTVARQGMLPSLPAGLQTAAGLPWLAEQILGRLPAGASAAHGADPVPVRVFDSAADSEPWRVPPGAADWLLNLAWPACQDLSGWIQALRRIKVVLDPDCDRAALLRLFGVAAWHCPPVPLSLPGGSQEDLVRHAQLHLGLPDPRWFRPPLELAVLGSSGAQQERLWGVIAQSERGAGLLLVPRLSRIVLTGREDALALQAWLAVLASHCSQLLLLEPLAYGACTPPHGAVVLGPENEHRLLAHWQGIGGP